MWRRLWHLSTGIWIVAWMAGGVCAQQKTLTWEAAKRELQATNPTLRAGRIGIQESRAEETTAFLRPNPELAIAVDQLNAFTTPYRPFTEMLPFVAVEYLHERRHKRELRLESAKQGTEIVVSQVADQERELLFDLRAAFVQVLQHKAVLAVTRENLGYYDRVLEVSRERFKAGDMAQMDLDRLELQRVQFESDVETASVNLRTAKIQLRALLNDRTPVDQLDVSGAFEYTEILTSMEEYRQAAFDNRPDLRAASEAVTKAKTDHQLAVANGSTDPVFGLDLARQLPEPVYFGVSITIPLRFFDRNQGEKARTQLEIGRTERLVEAAQSQVVSDVDSAYAALQSALNLLRPYKTRYLQQAVRVRETVSFSYQHGGASLLDFLQAQADYRGIQLSYLNLVASFLNAANQLNLAVGREVIP